MQGLKVSITRQDLKEQNFQNGVLQIVSNQSEINTDYTNLVELMIILINEK